MKTIPQTVKIRGKTVGVRESPRGYVFVGESCAELTDAEKDSARDDAEKWQELMYRAFERALSMERDWPWRQS